VEDGMLLDQTISIDGDGAGTIYIAYLRQSSGAFASMTFKVAKSTDDGQTWSVSELATSNCGDYNATRVLDANTVLVLGHCAGALEGLYLYQTVNGGGSWTAGQVVGSDQGAIDVG